MIDAVHFSSMKRRVSWQVYSSTLASDTNQPIPGYTNTLTLWARIEPSSEAEEVVSQVQEGMVTHRLTCRNVGPIKARDRFTYTRHLPSSQTQNVTLECMSVISIDDGRRLLVVLCKEVEA